MLGRVARASDRPTTKLTLPAMPSLRPQASGRGRGRGRVHSELICLLSFLMRYKSESGLSSLSVCHGRATSWESEASQATEVTTAAGDFSHSVLLSRAHQLKLLQNRPGSAASCQGITICDIQVLGRDFTALTWRSRIINSSSP